MTLNKNLLERCDGNCELCNVSPAEIEYIVSPKEGDDISEMVALCNTCFSHLDEDLSDYWRCLEGSIWSAYESVQVLSYRILYRMQSASWVNEVMNSVDLDEKHIAWAMFPYEKQAVHKDGFGNILVQGDTVVLTQNLNVKGTSFTAPKGTIVKKIKLVSDNFEQIEGKINDQTIVLFTKFVKKG